jgi:hypothetical protein
VADGEAPGTLTRLIEEVVRGAAEEAAAAPWVPGFRPGAMVGRYELLREVGRGGFGVVFEARDRELGRTVAFKVLRVGGEATRERRLLAEAEVAARLSHPNIVTVLDVGRSEQGVYLVQEFLTGAPLARRLAEGRLPVREAVRVGLEIARGLAHAHAHGVVHRDLTPGNVQLCDDGQVKLLDLGMAAALGRRTLAGGTPAYMAPEQARGDPEDERTDVYALGVLLYRMLTGAAPVEAGADGRPRSQARGLEVPEAPALAALVEAMLAAAPGDRPRDAGVVLEALREVSEGLPRSTGTVSRVRVRAAPRTRWALAGLAAGLALAAMALLAAGRWPHRAVSGGGVPSERAAVVAATSARTGCQWRVLPGIDLDARPPGAVVRNGGFQGQEAGTVLDRPAWRQRSDWNQLFTPTPATFDAVDVFAVQAEFHFPAAGEWPRSATMMVFTDPAGPDPSDLEHGLGLSITEEPGQAPTFRWGVVQGPTRSRVTYRGTLPAALGGRWHTLRIEGSRSRCWLRAILDGAPLLWSSGDCDLAGRHVLVAGSGASYRPADVAWREIMLSLGTAECQ